MVKIFVVYSLFIVILWYVLSPRRDVLETWETMIKMICGTIFGISWIVNCLGFVISLNGSDDSFASRDNLLIRLSFSLFFLYPIVSFIILAFRLPFRFGKVFDLDFSGCRDWKQDLLTELSKRIGLQRPPKIIQSGMKGITPFVFGRSSSEVFLVLPSNFDNLIRTVAKYGLENQRDCERTLAKFIFLHEIAHIKHRDVPFMTLMSATLVTLTKWFSLLVLVFVLMLIGLDFDPALERNLRTFAMLGPTLFVMWGLYLSSCRKREILADQRSTFYMTDQELKCLLDPDVIFQGKKTSIFEVLLRVSGSLQNISVNKPFQQDRLNVFVNFSSKNRLSSIMFSGLFFQHFERSHLAHWLASHPTPKSRVEHLLNKTRLSLSSLLPSSESIVFGAFASGLLIISYGLLTAYFPAFRNPDSWITVQFILFVGILSSILITLPFRSSIYQSRLSPKFLTRMSLSTSAFIIVEGTTIISFACFIFVVSGKPITSFYSTFITSLSFVRSVALMNLLLTAFVVFTLSLRLGTTFLGLDTRRIRLVLFLVGICVTCFVFSGIVYIRLFGNTLNMSIPLLFAFFGCVLSMPIIIFARREVGGSRYIQIRSFNKVIRIDLYSTKLRRLVSNSLEPLIVLAWFSCSVASAFAAGYLLKDSYLWNEAIFSSVLLIVGASFAFYVANQDTENGDSELFRYSSYFQDIPRTTQNPSLLVSKVRTLSTLWLRHNPLRDWESENISSIFRKIKIQSMLGFSDAFKKRVIDIIVRCENAQGGFSPWPGAPSEFYTTCQVVEILSLLNSTDFVDKGRHCSYLLNFRKPQGHFEAYSTMSMLTDTMWGVQSLCMLGQLEKVSGNKYTDWIKIRFINEQVSPQQMFCALKILHTINDLDSSTSRIARMNWFEPRLESIESLRLESDPENVHYLLRIGYMLLHGEGEDKHENLTLMRLKFEGTVAKSIIATDTKGRIPTRLFSET